MRSAPPSLFFAAVLALVVGACGSDRAGTGDGATTIATAVPATEPDDRAGCPDPHGGACLGALDGGSYTTASFDPAITYTVPSGWANLEDLPGNFLLQMTDDVRYLAIYQNVRAPAECDETWADGVGATVDDLVEWYTTHPGLTTSEPEEVTVGGLDGVFLDMSLEPSWDVSCPYSEGLPVVPFIIGNGTSSVHHVILPGFDERLYLLRWNGGNVAIEVGTEGRPLDDYLVDVLPIIETLAFGG